MDFRTRDVQSQLQEGKITGETNDFRNISEVQVADKRPRMQLFCTETGRGDTITEDGERLASSKVQILEQLDTNQGEWTEEYWINTWNGEQSFLNIIIFQ